MKPVKRTPLSLYFTQTVSSGPAISSDDANYSHSKWTGIRERQSTLPEIWNVRGIFVSMNIFFKVCYPRKCLSFPSKRPQKPPMFMKKNSTLASDNVYDGSWVEAIEWVSRRLNFKSYQIYSSLD